MIETERELFVETLRELLTIERELEDYLAGLAAAATDEDLSSYFDAHAETTTEQIARLETIFAGLENADEAPRESEVLAAIVAAHDDRRQDFQDPNLADRLTAETGREIERLELTKLETLRSLASRLDLPTEVVDPLETTQTEVENGLERLQSWSNLETSRPR
ncbi:DUF892 family protein [Halovivax limisalsi]|uniref:DUF892 family protein n=1 Tax=Halovivax limisalsi TaxID=1453760 RepID=UPI001FFD7E02|nr:DUF892 family protein [Halovivax limisalsi]